MAKKQATKTSQDVAAAIDEAMARAEIMDALQETSLTREKLRTLAQGRADDVAQASAREAKELEHVESEIEAVVGKLNAVSRNFSVTRIEDAWELSPRFPEPRRFLIFHRAPEGGSLHPRSVARNATWAVVIFAGLCVAAATAYLARAPETLTLPSQVGGFTLRIGDWRLFAGLLVLAPVVGSIPALLIRAWIVRRAVLRYNALADRARQNVEDTLLGSLFNRRAENAKALREALIERGALPTLRELINTHRTDDLLVTIPEIDPGELSEVFNPRFEIVTRHKRGLLALLEHMPGGSIGVAGPRGSGKTTLLRALCDGGMLKFRDKPVVSVMAPAPTGYEARAFILHLYAEVCDAILDRHDPGREYEKHDPPFGPRHFQPQQVEELVRRASGLCFFAVQLGAVLMILALSIVVMDVWLTRIDAPAVDATSTTTQREEGLPELSVPPTAPNVDSSSPTADGTAPDGDPASAQTDVEGGVAAVETSDTQPVAPQAAPSTAIQMLEELMARLGVTTGSLFSASLWLLVVGYLARVALQFYRTGARAERYDHETGQRRAFAGTRGLAELVDIAYARRREIRFQQSFTSGWSGGAKLPVGVGFNLNDAATFARHQMTLPEIVAGLRELLTRAARNDHVIFIGIDELDKIETLEGAARFINDIKVVFGVDGCFFLVSVSEDALLSFERRGLPLRDEFDSAFDDIVRVDHFAFADSSRLLQRRVIGFPLAARGLCHALAGGLPRDVIRFCRALLTLPNADGEGRTVSDCARRLARRELEGKLRALEAQVRRLGDAQTLADVGALVDDALGGAMAFGVNGAQAVSKRLREMALEVDQRRRRDGGLAPATARDEDDLAVSIFRTADYAAYCAELVQAFDYLSDRRDVEAMVEREDFDRLAERRRRVASDAPVLEPWDLVHKRRTANGGTSDPQWLRALLRRCRDGLGRLAKS